MSTDETSELCVLDHGKEKDGRKRVAQVRVGRLCGNHGKRLSGMLRDIAVDYALLDTRVSPMKSSGDYSSDGRGGGDEARPPLNLAVAALRDAERSFPPRARGDELWYELPDLPSVVGVIHARAEDLRATVDHTHDVDSSLRGVDLTTEIRLLLNGFNTLCAADWIDEAFDEIKHVWIALQSAHGRPRPRPLGDCISGDCDGKVIPRHNTHPWCSTCHRVYDTNAEIIKARIEQENRKAAQLRETA